MLKKVSRYFHRRSKKITRKLKHSVYRFLVAIYEGEIRFSLFWVVCTMFCSFLCVGFFFRTPVAKDTTTPVSVLGSELTHALRYVADTHHLTELDADITLFLLPDKIEDERLSSFLSTPLYGFYLTGKEVSYLPEYYASLSDCFVSETPYIGGLSFTYNPKRFLYNRATDITLYTKNGTYETLSEDALYYVIGSDSVFRMFHYLSERTYHLLNIQPKDANGNILSDYSSRLLRGALGTRTFYDIYRSYLLANNPAVTVTAADEIYCCDTLNTIALFSQLNGAGYFLIGSILLFLVLAAYLRPNLHRIYIWLRIFLIRRKKRGKISLRQRIYAVKTTRQRAA